MNGFQTKFASWHVTVPDITISRYLTPCSSQTQPVETTSKKLKTQMLSHERPSTQQQIRHLRCIVLFLKMDLSKLTSGTGPQLVDNNCPQHDVSPPRGQDDTCSQLPVVSTSSRLLTFRGGDQGLGAKC